MTNKESALYEMNKIVALYDTYLEYVAINGAVLSSNNDEADIASRYISRVFRTFMSMKEEEKEILNNEFFNRKKSGWWISKYKKEEYEAVLFMAITNFLRRFTNHAL